MPVTFAADPAAPGELSTDVLKKQFKERFEDLVEALADIPRFVGDYTAAEISVGFVVSPTGELRLLSASGGGPGVTATFQVKLVRHVQD
jgi:hypothetical protein